MNYFALFSQSERIISFYSDIKVDTSSIITVKESIKIYANGTLFKRGITRTIPTVSTDSLGKKDNLDFKILSVERDGRNSNFLHQHFWRHFEIMLNAANSIKEGL